MASPRHGRFLVDKSDSSRENVGLVRRVVRKLRVGANAQEFCCVDGAEQRFEIVTADDDLSLADLDANCGRIGVAPFG